MFKDDPEGHLKVVRSRVEVLVGQRCWNCVCVCFFQKKQVSLLIKFF